MAGTSNWKGIISIISDYLFNGAIFLFFRPHLRSLKGEYEDFTWGYGQNPTLPLPWGWREGNRTPNVFCTTTNQPWHCTHLQLYFRNCKFPSSGNSFQLPSCTLDTLTFFIKIREMLWCANCNKSLCLCIYTKPILNILYEKFVKFP